MIKILSKLKLCQAVMVPYLHAKIQKKVMSGLSDIKRRMDEQLMGEPKIKLHLTP